MAAKQRTGSALGCPRCAEVEARYHELVQELLAMKRDGFVPQGPQPEPVKMPELPPVIRQAIRDIAIPGSPLANQQAQLAWSMLNDGEEESMVAHKIRQGQEMSL